MADLKVGGEVDSFCTRCKLTLAHTVLAVWAGQIKRVRCNTCMGEHGYRGAPSTSSGAAASARTAKPLARAKAAPAARPVERISGNFEELIAGRSRASARRYNINDKYQAGDMIEHPTFGLGVVAAVRGSDKVDVAFAASARTLLHNRGAPPVPLARPLAPKVPDVALVEDETDPTEETSDEPELDKAGRA